MTIQNGVYACVQQLLDDTADSGWINLTLINSVTSYSPTQVPKYRKIGNKVYLYGAVKAITTVPVVIGVLPEGFRPPKSMSYVQNTSAQDSHPHFARIQIKADGTIEIQFTINDISTTTWFPIDTEFLID